MSYQSKYTGLEIDNKLDKVGEIGILDSIHAQLKEIWIPSVGGIVPFTKISGNMEMTNGKITVKPGQRVQIDVQLCSKTDTPSIKINRNFAIKDITNDIEIQGVYPIMNTGSNTMDFQSAFSYSAQYTNETDKDCEVAIVCTAIYSGGTPHMLSESGCGITVFEIGRAMVVPSEYKEVELLSEPVKFQQGGSGHKTINQDITLLDDIFNYDEIVFAYYAEFSNGSRAGLTEYRMQVSNHEYIRTDGTLWQLILAIPTQNVRQLLFCFPASNIINVGSTCMTSGSGDGYFHLSSIKGIKY